MDHASPATFRPTWQQSAGRGCYLGAVGAAGVLLITTLLVWAGVAEPPGWFWPAVVAGLPIAGALVALVAGRRTGTQISAGGIRTLSVFSDDVASWDDVADLRAERRGGRTAVAVYLHSGASVRLQAPYSGGLLAADPGFEGKMFALSHLYRSHRFGGLPG